MNRTVVRYIVPLIAAAAMMPTAAFAADVAEPFDPSSDRTAWYWAKQAEAPAAGLGALIPSPQSADSLPVALEGGQPEKTSAVFFDLADRGVPVGATITRLDVSILEGSVSSEAPGFEIAVAMIRACRITGLWGEAQAQTLTAQPGHDESICVEGRRTARDDTNVWTFDLLAIAAAWDEPTLNRGFLLFGKSPDTSPAQTWQVNLKRPLKDDPATEPNEYEATKGSLSISLSYTSPSEGTNDVYKRLGSSLLGGPPFVTTPVPPVAQAPSTANPTTPVTSPVASAVPFATMPQIVWVLVPLGLALIAVMSWIVWEPDPAGRPLWMRAMGFDAGIGRGVPQGTESFRDAGSQPVQ